jgi:hypothetical protein
MKTVGYNSRQVKALKGRLKRNEQLLNPVLRIMRNRPGVWRKERRISFRKRTIENGKMAEFVLSLPFNLNRLWIG